LRFSLARTPGSHETKVKGTGAHVRLPIGRAVGLRRHDRDVIVAGEIGEIGVAAVEGEDDLVLAVGLDVLDRRQHRLHADFESLPI